MTNSTATDWINRIVPGDCVELMKALPRESVPLVVTSPPYGSMRDYGGHKFDAEAVIKGICEVVQPGGIVVWVERDQVHKLLCSGSTFANYKRFLDCGMNLVVPLVMSRLGLRHTQPRHYGAPEFALVMSKGSPRTCSVIRDRRNKTAGQVVRHSKRHIDGTVSTTKIGKKTKEFGPRHPVWVCPTGSLGSARESIVFNHPAIMAESMAKDLIVSFSRPGDLVFDPMAGSGTTAKMAILTHRRFLGFEIHEPYVAIAEERVRLAQEIVQRQLDESWSRRANTSVYERRSV